MNNKQEHQITYSQAPNSLFVEPEKKGGSRITTLLGIVLCIAIFVFGGGAGAYIFFGKNSIENANDNRKVDFIAFKETSYATEFKIKSIHRNIEINKKDGNVKRDAVVYVFDIENKGVTETQQEFNFYGMTNQKAIVTPLKNWEISGSSLWETYNCRSGGAVLKKGEKSTICLIYPSSINTLLLEETENYQTAFRSVKIDEFTSELTGYQKKFNEQVDANNRKNEGVIDRMIEMPKQIKSKYSSELCLPVTYTVKEKGEYTPILLRGEYVVELKNGLFVLGRYGSYTFDTNYMSKNRVQVLIGEEGVKVGQEIKYYEVFDTKEVELRNIYYLVNDGFEKQYTYYYEV